MNSSDHHVSRETVVLYFLDELNSSDRKRVQLAVRKDPEIMDYYLRQLRMFARIDSIDGLSDDDKSFMRHLGLSMDEFNETLELDAIHRSIRSTVDKDPEIAVGPVIVAFPKTFIAKNQPKPKAAGDRPKNLEPGQTERTVDELVWWWKQGSNEYDTIVLWFSSGKKELGDTISMQVNVEWRQSSNGDLNRSELQRVSLTRMRNGKVSEWEGEFCLRPFMQDNEKVESITTVQGTLNV